MFTEYPNIRHDDSTHESMKTTNKHQSQEFQVAVLLGILAEARLFARRSGKYFQIRSRRRRHRGKGSRVPIDSKGFKEWLGKRFRGLEGRLAGKEALDETIRRVKRRFRELRKGAAKDLSHGSEGISPEQKRLVNHLVSRARSEAFSSSLDELPSKDLEALIRSHLTQFIREYTSLPELDEREARDAEDLATARAIRRSSRERVWGDKVHCPEPQLRRRMQAVGYEPGQWAHIERILADMLEDGDVIERGGGYALRREPRAGATSTRTPKSAPKGKSRHFLPKGKRTEYLREHRPALLDYKERALAIYLRDRRKWEWEEAAQGWWLPSSEPRYTG